MAEKRSKSPNANIVMDISEVVVATEAVLDAFLPPPASFLPQWKSVVGSP